MPSRKPKSAYRDDPLVSIDRGFLKAAVDLSGREVQEIATKARTTKQNLRHMMLQPGPGKCRKKLRTRLAKQLSVPEPLLAGGLTLTEGWVRYALGADVLSERRGAWAALRLLDNVMKAVHRDAFNDKERFDVAYAVGALVSPTRWRERCIGIETLGDSQAGGAAVALATALNFALAPWLKGERPLDVAELTSMAEAKTVQHGGMAYPPPINVFRPLSDWNELFSQLEPEFNLDRYVGGK
ncbi:MAG: hypothetical protein M3R65_05315 [Gemmatimonadota bacterium]|nr:hypothetical protein [Gemmatimonadota bacterium]